METTYSSVPAHAASEKYPSAWIRVYTAAPLPTPLWYEYTERAYPNAATPPYVAPVAAAYDVHVFTVNWFTLDGTWFSAQVLPAYSAVYA